MIVILFLGLESFFVLIIVFFNKVKFFLEFKVKFFLLIIELGLEILNL